MLVFFFAQLFLSHTVFLFHLIMLKLYGSLLFLLIHSEYFYVVQTYVNIFTTIMISVWKLWPWLSIFWYCNCLSTDIFLVIENILANKNLLCNIESFMSQQCSVCTWFCIPSVWRERSNLEEWVLSNFRRILFSFKVNILSIVYMLLETYFRYILIEETVYADILASIVLILFRDKFLARFNIEHIFLHTSYYLICIRQLFTSS